MYVEVVIAESARKHGVPDDDILHAYRNPFQTTYYDEGLSMLIGATAPGTRSRSASSTTTRPKPT